MGSSEVGQRYQREGGRVERDLMREESEKAVRAELDEFRKLDDRDALRNVGKTALLTEKLREARKLKGVELGDRLEQLRQVVTRGHLLLELAQAKETLETEDARARIRARRTS